MQVDVFQGVVLFPGSACCNSPGMRLGSCVITVAAVGSAAPPCRHGKRSTVSVEDVKLCCRRSPSLLEFISRHGDSLRAAKEGGEEGRRRKGRKGHTDKAKEPEAMTVEDSD